MWKWYTAGLTLFCVIQYQLWSFHGAVRTVWLRQAAWEAEQQRTEALRLRNAVLAAEVRDLKQGLVVAEERARQDWGWIKPGETFYLWVENAKDFAE